MGESARVIVSGTNPYVVHLHVNICKLAVSGAMGTLFIPG